MIWLVGMGGCRKAEERTPVHPVRGLVLFNGEPAADAFVVFHPKVAGDPFEKKPRATTDKSGAFVIGTHSADDGSPLGEYIVTVALGGGGVVRGESRVVPPFEDPERSQLRFEVRVGDNVMPTIKLP